MTVSVMTSWRHNANARHLSCGHHAPAGRQPSSWSASAPFPEGTGFAARCQHRLLQSECQDHLQPRTPFSPCSTASGTPSSSPRAVHRRGPSFIGPRGRARGRHGPGPSYRVDRRAHLRPDRSSMSWAPSEGLLPAHAVTYHPTCHCCASPSPTALPPLQGCRGSHPHRPAHAEVCV